MIDRYRQRDARKSEKEASRQTKEKEETAKSNENKEKEELRGGWF